MLFSNLNLKFQVDNVLFVAGQIGLIPGSMDLPDIVEIQAQLSLRHLIRILQVYQMDVTNVVQVRLLKFSFYSKSLNSADFGTSWWYTTRRFLFLFESPPGGFCIYLTESILCTLIWRFFFCFN